MVLIKFDRNVRKYIAEALEPFHRLDVLADLKENENLEALTESTVTAIEDGKVVYMKKNGETCEVNADFIVSAFGQRPVKLSLQENLDEEEIPYAIAGDASKTGNFKTATRQAFDAVLDI